MSVNVKLKHSNDSKSLFPCLCKWSGSTNSNLVILMISNNKGIVVSPGDKPEHQIFTYAENWADISKWQILQKRTKITLTVG